VRDAVEVSRRGGLVRVGDGMRSRHPVEPVSYEADLSCVLKWAVLYRDLVAFIFIIDECGYPYTISTDTCVRNMEDQEWKMKDERPAQECRT
jgi:hypothetical protein